MLFGLAPGKMAQAATEIPEGRTLSGIDFSGVTVASSWEDKYDQAFYSKIESEYENGYTTADTALEIGTAAELAAFAKFVNSGEYNSYNTHSFENKFVCLTDDIDLGGVAPTVDYQNDGDDGFKVVLTGAVSNNWVPIGDIAECLSFNGTFDGKNHSILGMTVKTDEYGGLFGFVRGLASIQNVGVKNSVVIAGKSAGKIAGYADGLTIQNCYATGEIYARYKGGNDSTAGGILGYSYGSSIIKNCYNSGDVFAMSTSYEGFCGGICGFFWYQNNMENCFSTGRVYAYSSTGMDCLVGGLVVVDPYHASEIINSYYDKDVAGDIDAAPGDSYTENVEGLTTAEFKQKLVKLKDTNGNRMWFLEDLGFKLKTPRSSDFTFTLPDDLDYDGQGKTITIAPKPGITGMGAVTVKYYKVENGSTTLLDGSPTDAGRYKVKFDVAEGTSYAAATDLPAMF